MRGRGTQELGRGTKVTLKSHHRKQRLAKGWKAELGCWVGSVGQGLVNYIQVGGSLSRKPCVHWDMMASRVDPSNTTSQGSCPLDDVVQSTRVAEGVSCRPGCHGSPLRKGWGEGCWFVCSPASWAFSETTSGVRCQHLQYQLSKK